jgi:type I restriction enzyme R subunit
MPTPGEHKTVQSRILEYAQAVGWTFVSREEAERRRAGFPTRLGLPHGGQECPPSAIAGKNARASLSLFFDDLLDAKVREFNPRYAEAEGALLGQFRHLHSDIYGNRGRLTNQAAYIARYCDKARSKSLSRYLLRLD